MATFYSFILIILILIINLTIVVLIEKQNNLIKELIEQINSNKDKKNTYREHKAISKSNFASILQGRTNAYAKYQNKDGLYEPIKPKAGIELKNKREE